MVFCGRPSKACQRCRARKLHCDLRSGSCGQCTRAQAPCTGYRDVQELRIRNESQAVRRKAEGFLVSGKAFPLEPRSPTLSLVSQARDVFFAHYVPSTSKAWDFLRQFYHPLDSPEYLTLSIDAASLAYLSHQVYSDAALMIARERYVTALRKTNRALQSVEEATKDTTLISSLVLDLFEKITNSEPLHNKSWKGHVDGALALVRFRGLKQFQDPSAVRMLARLSNNLLISCVASDNAVPAELTAIRTHVGQLTNAKDPKWKLSDLMVHLSTFRSDVRTRHLSVDSRVSTYLKFDTQLQALASDMPLSWQYKTKSVDRPSEGIYGEHFDFYADLHVTQTWNVLRLVRILLNESIIESCQNFTASITMGDPLLLLKAANDNIQALACDICASVPQYTICSNAVSSRLSVPTSFKAAEFVEINLGGADHQHSPSQKFDCYTLIYPLYVAGQSRGSPPALKAWAIKQLDYIGSHYGIRNAELVGQILEKGTDINPWAVYAMLGSYAFAA